MSEMRAFFLYRHSDVTGVSGTGVIAEGFRFSDGTVVLCWRPLYVGHHASVAFWPSIDDMIAVHGHDGKTTVEWIDYPIDENVWRTSSAEG